MTPAARASSDILLVTELFPPSIGGSAELLWNVYSRIDSVRVAVLTDVAAAGGDPAAVDRAIDVTRRAMHARSWGTLTPGALAHHLRTAGAVRRLAPRSAVVHCARVLPEGLAALLAGTADRRPYVCWIHGEELAYMRSSRELTWLARRVCRGAAALVANSHNTASLLEPFGVASDRVHVVYPGVDADRFRADSAARARIRQAIRAPDDLVLLTVGRLQSRKGHDHVIDALAGLRDQLPRLRYVIVGDGDERGRLEQLARHRGVADRVVFAGKVPVSDLPAYYAAADIFVHPNRVDDGDFEGFGIVFLEAAAAGLPVIGGITGGVPEAIAAEVTGLLVSGTDVDEMRCAILRLATSPGIRAAMGRAGRARVVSAFTWRGAATRVEAIHRQISTAARPDLVTYARA
jgi:phosphatidylinositol alpha-1,6-mannosyltransferase